MISFFPFLDFKCENADTLQKHKWKLHPKNNYKKLWSKHAKENFKNWNESSYFESFGPYY